MKFKDTYEIIQVLEAHDLKYKYKKPTFYPLNHVFDEDKSVKWNAEERERKNSILLQELQNKHKEERDARMIIYNDIYDFIVMSLDFKISKMAAQTIWDRAYESEISYGYQSVMDELESLIDFISNILKEF